MAGSQDALEFYARYKDWNVSRILSISESTSQKDIAAYLAELRNEVDKRSFEILGLETRTLDAYAEKITKGMQNGNPSAIVNVYKLLGSSDTEETINKATNNREEIKPFAKAYILRQAMSDLGIDYCLNAKSKSLAGNTLSKTQKNGSSPLQSEGISFMAKYGTWVSIKKMSITPNTKPEEVSAHLTSIRSATDRKGVEALGIDTEALETYASNVTGSMRKSAANLEKVANALSAQDAKKEIDAACKGNASIRDAAQMFLFSTMLKNLKIDFYVSPDTLMDMFPGLKIPKPKGNFGGKRKKQ
jgi:hypothetical protein